MYQQYGFKPGRHADVKTVLLLTCVLVWVLREAGTKMELNEMWTLLEETPVRESEAGGEQGWENHDREGRGTESWGGSPPDCLNV